MRPRNRFKYFKYWENKRCYCLREFLSKKMNIEISKLNGCKGEIRLDKLVIVTTLRMIEDYEKIYLDFMKNVGLAEESSNKKNQEYFKLSELSKIIFEDTIITIMEDMPLEDIEGNYHMGFSGNKLKIIDYFSSIEKLFYKKNTVKNFEDFKKYFKKNYGEGE